jgi:hypothetical protein
MNVASVTVMATIHGFTRGRHGACGAATACETSGTSATLAAAIDSYLDTAGCDADSLYLPPSVTNEIHPPKVLRLILAPHAAGAAVRCHPRETHER